MNIKIVYHPVYESIVSAQLANSKKLHKQTDLGGKWRKKQFEEAPSCLRPLFENESLNPALAWLESYLHFKPPAAEESPLEEIKNWEEATFTEIRHKYSLHQEASAEEIREAAQLLLQWQEHYVRHLPPFVEEGLRFSFQHMKEQLEAEPSGEQLERVTNGLCHHNYPEEHEFIISPQFHCRPVILFSHYEQRTIYQVPVEMIPSLDGGVQPALTRLPAALADESRLRLLQVLAEKEQATFTDLYKEAHLAKSTVHHHLIILRASGLVRVHLSLGAKDTYSLRTDQLQQYPAQLLSYLRKEGEK
ncbi:ArsR/SmtB family transcription factor [Salsuginibacillus kocurii]|uniref:ArsR/SmtB family transcription factor n=1 Tax=Salsuginibacillus kocurii TaxID=427078 RepID=UPI000374440D|nr:helix-turn-helix domain-containing protein [Salsuginibacillus kocurii]